jgi:glycosyltransferase involved in cell wall biosynthesis
METLKFLMTTTFYPPFHIGGDAVHVKYLAEELVKRGHEVHVMHSVDAYRIKRGNSVQESDRADGPVVHSLRSPRGAASIYKTYAFGRSVFHEREYERILREFGPDVVHHHNISLLGHTILRKRGAYRQLYTAHDYWLLCQRNDLTRGGKPCDGKGCNVCAVSSGRPPQLWRRRLNLDGIDCIIAPSRYMAEKLAGLNRPVEVVPNFTPIPPAEIADAAEPGYFLYLGVLEPHKGVLELVDGFARNGHRLVIAGRGSLSKHIEREIAGKKLGPRVRYDGWADDKWAVMKGACAMVLPSLWPENSPLSVLEAMSVGTPTFCTDLGGTREIVERVSPELVIPVDKLAERLRELVPPKLERNFVKGVYDLGYTPDKYLARYLSIAGGGAPST